MRGSLYSLCVLLCQCGIADDAWAAQVSFGLATQPTKCPFHLTNTKGQEVQKGHTPFIGKLEQGRYRLVVRCPGHLEEARILDVQKDVLLQLSPFPDPKARTTRTPPPRTRPTKRRTNPAQATRTMPPTKRGKTPLRTTAKSKSTKKTIPWIPLITGVLLLSAGGVVVLVSQQMYANAADKNNYQLDAYREHLSAGELQSASIFLLGAGGVALAISGLMYAWGWPSRKKKRGFHTAPRAGLSRPFPVTGVTQPKPIDDILPIQQR